MVVLRKLLLLSLVFTSACAARVGVKVGEIPTPVLPTENEVQAANGFIGQHLKAEGYKDLGEKSKETQRVKSIINRLGLAAGFTANSFPVKVVDAGDEVNAMAVNSAAIVVYKGLVDKVPSDDELSVVLAHEIGHMLGRHAQEEKIKQERAEAVGIGSMILGTVAAVATSAAGLNGAADLAGDLTEGATDMLGYGAFVGKFDREQEYEADHIGLMLMAKAGYDPKMAPKFWARSEEVFGDRSSQLGAFFNTHPAESDREEGLLKAMPLAEAHYIAAKEAEKTKLAQTGKNISKKGKANAGRS